MRLSDDDRERLLDLLGAHAAAGRLTVEELEGRLEVVARAQTTEETAPALADLPPIPASPGPGSPAPGGASVRRRRHGETDRPSPGWQPTPERFRDPRSGRVMRVWVDGAGARHYVPES